MAFFVLGTEGKCPNAVCLHALKLPAFLAEQRYLVQPDTVSEAWIHTEQKTSLWISALQLSTSA